MVEPAWIGRRIVIRRAVARGFSDVLGDLLELTDDEAVVDTRAGRVVVPLDDVVAAKIPEASTAEILHLEAICAQGWQSSEQQWLDGWLLRANDGFTQRANSVIPLRQLARPLPEAVDAAAAWYHARGLPLRLLIPLPARRLLDGALTDLGYQPSPDTVVMAARLGTVTMPPEPSFPVEVDEEASEDWLAAYRHGGRPVNWAGRELLIRHDRAGFALIRHDGAPIAVARGTVDHGWLGVTGVEVAPEYRRQGLASALMRALWSWGRTHAATHSYVQVVSDNHAAIAAYERLGYWVHHVYRYRAEPGGPPATPSLG